LVGGVAGGKKISQYKRESERDFFHFFFHHFFFVHTPASFATPKICGLTFCSFFFSAQRPLSGFATNTTTESEEKKLGRVGGREEEED
jgi:hypothetical protein